MTDNELRRAYARFLTDQTPVGREGCVSAEALLALVERRGSEGARLETLDHAGSCEACRRDLELLRAVHRAGEGMRVRRAVLHWPSWVLASRGGLAVAAVLVVAVGATAVLQLRRHDAVMRGGSPVLSLISPAGSVAAGEPVTLTWHSALGTDRYEVEVLGLNGDSMFAGATPDTALMLPAEVLLVAGEEYLWSVRAVMRDGTHAAAETLRFRVNQR